MCKEHNNWRWAWRINISDNQINVDLFSKRLKDAIKHSGYTQKDFSKKIKISSNALRNILNGKNLPSLQTYLNICNTLSIPFVELIKDSVYEPKLLGDRIDSDLLSFIYQTTDAEKCAVVDFLKILQTLRKNR